MIARSELSSSPFSRWQHSMNVLECASKIPRGRAERRARARPDRRRIPLRLRHRSLVRPPVAPGGGNSRSQGQSNAQTNQRRHRNTYKDARAREPRRIGGRASSSLAHLASLCYRGALCPSSSGQRAFTCVYRAPKLNSKSIMRMK